MIPLLPAQKAFRTTALLWVLFVFTTFLNPGFAAPQPIHGLKLSPRVLRGTNANNAPGLGIEIEQGSIVIVGKRKLTPEEREKIKGAEITPIGFAGGAKTNWKLTAELGAPELFPEAIVDGTKNMVGDHETAGIGEEIYKYFKDWGPCESKDCKVSIKDFDNLGPWSVTWPKKDPRDLTKFPFTNQVTTAMPLEAVLQILSDTKNKKQNPLASDGALDANKIKILTKNNFKSFKKIKQADITDEFLGFFSLLSSYCVLAHASNPKEGPKRLIPVMPRTDFLAQYSTFIEPKLKEQLSDKKTTLYDIIEKASGSSGKLAQDQFKWKSQTPNPINEDWAGKKDDLEKGNLQVEKFLDYLQGYDKKNKKAVPQMDLVKLMDRALRHGQVGGFDGRMEPILGTSKLVPIFEFRELKGVLGAELGAAMGSYEDKVIDYHKQSAKRGIDISEASEMLADE
ncbi:hypothetical protein EJ08DRAFT_696718 [Tothia fuscella]|uniref:Uncharacterized protein n=1 Tax=Tothia fuscella TaxID=1048955 RepID=A0A9P4NTJ8_9PEZI|nr:hypothetical protein EJ08DRAFT_696718 [Tothia fuscella]